SLAEAGLPPPRQAAELVQTLAGAVHHCHEHGIVHRDLKPANVLLTRDGTPKITDFGLAKGLDDRESLTATGAIVGTVAYMAAERAGGQAEAVGRATDVWALGVILYQLLTGRRPFLGATLAETLEQVLRHDPAPPRQLRAGLERDLEMVCLKCLEK